MFRVLTDMLTRFRTETCASRLLLVGFAIELVHLFAIVVTQGYLAIPSSPPARFTIFSTHAAIAWLFLALRYAYVLRVAPRALRREKAAYLLVFALALVGARLHFEHGVRLSADAPHYFVQAHSLLFDHDLDFTNDYVQVRPRATGIAARVPIGLALLSIPFLLTAHLLVLLGTALGYGFEANGFGYPYETAFELSGYVFATVALLVLLRTTKRLLPLGTSTLALVTAWVSSFLFWYMVIEPGMPHAMSFAWATFFICYWLEHRSLSRRRDGVILGVLIGVAAMVRWQNGIFILLPIVDRLSESPRSVTRAVPMVLASLAAFAPQFVFWWITAGTPLVLATMVAPSSQFWSQLGLFEVLYSTNRGLFPWNPVLYLATIGLVVALRYHPRLATLLLLGLSLQIYVNASVGIWWAGWSFGGRRFASCFPFFVLGLGFLFELLRRNPWILIVASCGLLVLWNKGVMQQARKGDIPPDRLVSFQVVSQRNFDLAYETYGFPFAAPANWLFATRYGVSPEKFDRLFGHEGFGNFRLSLDGESEPYTGPGWSEPEQDDGGVWFRWAKGRESVLLVPLKQPRSYELMVDVRPSLGANSVAVIVNGKVHKTHQISQASELRWVVEASELRQGLNVITFFHGRTRRPSDRGSSDDSRELALVYRRVELVALPSE